MQVTTYNKITHAKCRENMYHRAVLSNEVLEAFSKCHIRSFVDGTLGAGGHASLILQSHPEIEVYIGIDQDTDALHIATEKLSPWQEKLRLFRGNFSDMGNFISQVGLTNVDGILLDLGVSSMQLDQPQRGFSFMHDAPLDMRMDDRNVLTAAVVVNTWSEDDIGYVFREYGEEKRWRAAARAIVTSRAQKPIATTKELAEVLRPVLQANYSKKKINPLTLVFQALRICVNRELEVIEEVLPKALKSLSTGGRLAVISFHSLEDRIVKNYFRFSADDKMSTKGLGGGLFIDKKPEALLVTRKALAPTEQEMAENPRSRSAKMRVIEKL